MPHTQADEIQPNSADQYLEGVVLAINQAAEQAAPPSLALPRKGGGNTSTDAVRRKANDAKGKL
jgi:hypothetical protein